MYFGLINIITDKLKKHNEMTKKKVKKVLVFLRFFIESILLEKKKLLAILQVEEDDLDEMMEIFLVF